MLMWAVEFRDISTNPTGWYIDAIFWSESEAWRWRLQHGTSRGAEEDGRVRRTDITETSDAPEAR